MLLSDSEVDATMPVSNRVNGRVGLSVKIDSTLYEIFKAILWKYNLYRRISGAQVVEQLILKWIEDTEKRVGKDVLAEWATDMRAELATRRKWTSADIYEALHGEPMPARSLWEPRTPDEPDYDEWVKRCEEDGI